MIEIAICDDSKTTVESIEKMLNEFSASHSIKVNCSLFFDGSELVKSIQQGIIYDLIYLDIEMNTLNGISTAEYIRNLELTTLIVYISNHEKYLKDLFDTEPFRFLSKPLDKEKFQSVFIAACKRIEQKTEYFSFSYNKEIIKLPINHISYFESHNRTIHIHEIFNNNKSSSPEGMYKFYEKLNTIENQFLNTNTNFIRIHQSYLVNCTHIKSITFTTVTLFDGTKLQISADRQKSVRAKFCTLIGKEISSHDGI